MKNSLETTKNLLGILYITIGLIVLNLSISLFLSCLNIISNSDIILFFQGSCIGITTSVIALCIIFKKIGDL